MGKDENAGKADVSSQFKKGILELCILTLLTSKDYYGYQLVEEISKKVNLAEGTVYPILRRLTQEKYFETYLKESNEGPPRKYYRLTKLGREVQGELIGQWKEFNKNVNALLKMGEREMTKREYLEELTQHLRRLPAQEIEEILADYREHFEAALQAGKNETEVCKSLGNPRSVANGYMVNSLVEEAKASSSVTSRTGILFKVMFLILVLAPFNFFVIIGPFVILLALTMAGWALPVAFGGVSIALIGALISQVPGFVLGSLEGLSLLFMFFGSLGLAALLAMVMILISKFFTQLVASYLRWNVNFITSKRS